MINVNEKTFEQEVLNCELPVVVDFWAPWCGPCMKLSPIIEQVASELNEKVKIVKVNTDENFGLALKFRVETIPTLLYFKSGELVKTTHGFMEKEELINEIKSVI